MFDFAFSELLVICVVALVVLGPTRLPGVVRKVGRWVGKARTMAREFREQLENEVNIEELGRATRHSHQDTPPPPAPAEEAAATSGDPAAGTDTTPATVPAEPDGVETMARSGYPYGMPTDTSTTTADPAVASAMGEPADDSYSHAHAAGDAPEPWSPEAGPAAEADAAPAPDHPAAPDPDKRNA